jgi:hypothetical protein
VPDFKLLLLHLGLGNHFKRGCQTLLDGEDVLANLLHLGALLLVVGHQEGQLELGTVKLVLDRYLLLLNLLHLGRDLTNDSLSIRQFFFENLALEGLILLLDGLKIDEVLLDASLLIW